MAPSVSREASSSPISAPSPRSGSRGWDLPWGPHRGVRAVRQAADLVGGNETVPAHPVGHQEKHAVHPAFFEKRQHRFGVRIATVVKRQQKGPIRQGGARVDPFFQIRSSDGGEPLIQQPVHLAPEQPGLGAHSPGIRPRCDGSRAPAAGPAADPEARGPGGAITGKITSERMIIRSIACMGSFSTGGGQASTLSA